MTDSERFLANRLKRAEQARNSPKTRIRILNSLHSMLGPVPEGSKDSVGVVLGTSPLLPDKFLGRLITASNLLKAKKLGHIIFTGGGDSDPKYNQPQSEVFKDLAILLEGISLRKISTVGGINTAENLKEARDHILQFLPGYKRVIIISNSDHLARSQFVTKNAFINTRLQVGYFPISGRHLTDPNHPSIITECVKTSAYHGVHSGIRFKGYNDHKLYRDHLLTLDNHVKQLLEDVHLPSSKLPTTIVYEILDSLFTNPETHVDDLFIPTWAT